MKLYQKLATLVNARLNCITTGNTEWRNRHEEEIDRLVKDHMPSGSGFDLGTVLTLEPSHGNHLVFETSYHHMNEHGFYDGWSSHVIRVVPDLASGFDLKIGGRDRNDIKDYIAEVFSHSLGEDVTDGGAKMAYVIMEKLDDMTPAYPLRAFNHRQEAVWEIRQLIKERGDNTYPQWSLLVERMEKDYPI